MDNSDVDANSDANSDATNANDNDNTAEAVAALTIATPRMKAAAMAKKPRKQSVTMTNKTAVMAGKEDDCEKMGDGDGGVSMKDINGAVEVDMVDVNTSSGETADATSEVGSPR